MKSLLLLFLNFLTNFEMFFKIHLLALCVTISNIFTARALDARESIAVFILALVKSDEIKQSSLDELAVEMHLVEQHWQVSAVLQNILQLVPSWILTGEENVRADVVIVKRLLHLLDFVFVKLAEETVG